MKELLGNRKTERNPDGLTKGEFIHKYPGMKNIANMCWFFGLYPEELREELKTLLRMDNGNDTQN